jgi:hypothetical protein
MSNMMLSRIARGLFCAVLVTLAFPLAAFGWGRDGHAIIAEIAYDRLTPAARREVLKLLGDSTMVEVSSWPDSIGRDQPETKPWHYVDIPVDGKAEHFNEARDGKNGNNVIDKLNDFEKTLTDPNASGQDRTIALKWVIHLVGDIHQPLHCADRAFAGKPDDRGGNDVRVELEAGGRPFNLHSAWDSAILDRMLLPEGEYPADFGDDLARQLDDPKNTTLQNQEKSWRAVTEPVAWANESHDIAASVVYKNIPTTEPSESPNSDQKTPAATQLIVPARSGASTTGVHSFGDSNLIELTPAYMQQAAPVVRKQLEKAGVRLADVLNRLFRND